MVRGRPAMLSSIRRILGKSGLDACMMMLCGYSINPRSEWVQGIAATSYAFDPARYSDISEAVDEVYTHYAAQGVSEVCTFYVTGLGFFKRAGRLRYFERFF